MESLYGYEEGTFPGNYEGFSGRVHPDDLVEFERVRDEAVNQSKPFEFDFRIQLPSGETRWIGCKGAAHYDDEGNPERVLGINVDITESKLSEERLREYEKVVESSAEMIIVVDRDYRYIIANNMFLKYWGLEESQVLGRSVPEIIGKEAFENSVKNKLDECFEGHNVHYERKFYYPHIGERDISLSYFPIYDPHGVDRATCIMRDISDWKKAGEVLQESEEKFRSIFENSPVGVVHADAEGIVTACNDSFIRIVGTPREKMIGLDSIRDLNDENLMAAVREALAGRTGHHEGEYTSRITNKTVYLKADIAPMFDAEGSVIGAIGIYEDIAERRRAAQEREATIGFLRLVNESRETGDLISAATAFFQEWSGCDAVGIRLHDGEDYPYYEVRGFPEDFVLLENHLCSYDENNCVQRDNASNPVLECMCGNVICGRFDPSKPFFTEQGSFWTNCTTDLLASTTEEDRQALTRKRCNGEGYESVALIPLGSDDDRLGLLQLNDKRKDRFTPETIALWERLAHYLSAELAKFKAEKALQRAHDELEFRIQERTAELERANETIETERQRLYSVLETLPVYVCLLDSDYRMPFANRYFREAFGESQGLRCHDFLFNRAEPCEICETFTVMKTGEPHHWYWTGPNGRDYDVYDFTFIDADGSMLILEMGIDITERKEAEKLREKAFETAEIITKIFSTTHFCIVFLDQDFNFIQVNQAYADVCGYPPEFFPGKNHFDLYPHEENESIFRRVVETGETFTIYARPFEFPDDQSRGVTFWDWTLHPVKDSQGRVEALIFILLDVTEREQAQKMVRENEKKFRLVTETIQDVFWMSSPGVGQMIYVSPAYEKIWGKSIESLYESPQSFLEVVHPEDVEGLKRIFEEYHAKGRAYSHEYRIIGADGSIRWIEERGFPIDDDQGNVLAMCGVSREITRQKRAEHLLELRAEDLARSNRDLEQFAYVASHDLQEPLRNVASCLQMLEQKYKSNLDAEADKLIHYAVEGSVRMKALLQDLLAYSRVATRGKAPERIDCEQVLEQTLKNLGGAISKAKAVITHDPLPRILADETQLLQAFQNLIHNAIKFRKAEPPQIHVSAVKNEHEWVFSVKDNGIGIESNQLERIFVIFQRLHKRGKYEGTGMGLAIVKKVVERHGGRVWAESELGVGTTFYFTIPEKRIQT